MNAKQRFEENLEEFFSNSIVFGDNKDLIPRLADKVWNWHCQEVLNLLDELEKVNDDGYPIDDDLRRMQDEYK